MKRKFALAIVLGLLTIPAFCDEPEPGMQLIYPKTAIDVTELDSTTPEKRAEPPVRETSEYDPTTPIGQIRSISESLKRLEEDRAAIHQQIKGLEEVNRILPLLEREAQRSESDSSNIDSLVQSSRVIGTKIDDLKKTTENLRASVEAVQKTAASIESIRQSRWTDYAVLAILALLLLNLLAKIVSFVGRRAKMVAQAWERVKKELKELAEEEPSFK